jgi:hypothetical protein
LDRDSGARRRDTLRGRAMNAQVTGYTRKSGDKGYVFYCRCPRAYGYDGESSHRKNQRDDKWELAIWKLVSGLLKEPERIREDLEQAEKNVLEAVDEVAQRLGNTRDIARES